MNLSKDIESSLHQRFFRQIEKLWPAIKGSLAEVKKPCIRPNCRACAQGIKHRAFLLSFTQNKKQHTMYVPAAWVPALRAALRNGQAIEELLQQMGPELLRQYRKARDAKLKSDSP